MLKRLPSAILLLALLLLTTSTSSGQGGVGVGAPPGPTFVIVSVTYTDANNKQQTVPLGTPQPQLPAVAAQNPIVINGTYSPGNATVTATIVVGSTSVNPPYNNGTWAATVPAANLVINQYYSVYSQLTGNNGNNTPNVAIVNMTNVNVNTGLGFSIAANNP